MIRESSEWYEQAFGELYPVLYPHRDENTADMEIAALADALEFTGAERVLDCCCGSGRHLKALLTRGFDAWGMDLSLPLLLKARDSRDIAGRIVRADVRSLPFRETFDLVLSLFTSFGYFTTDEENRAVLQEMFAMLTPDSTLVVDHMNRHRILTTLVPESRETCGEFEVTQRRRIQGNRVIKDIVVTSHGSRKAQFTEDVRMFNPEELTVWFEAAGFEHMRLMGSFAGEDFADDSERMIVVGHKAR
jgi:SAM-dependent methyltransferase